MVESEVLWRIKQAKVDCPDCQWCFDDDQYTCTTCWCQGGRGEINVYDYLLEHKELIED